ncbi:hypothetical protein Tco_0271295 [Tanacetum coccineum]
MITQRRKSDACKNNLEERNLKDQTLVMVVKTIRDRGKTVGGAIGARGSGIGDMASEAKRYLDKKDQKRCFPVRLGNSPVKLEYSQEYV